jgi:predicted transcriptional regulator
MPRRRSLTLTDHELRLMNVLWERKSASVAEVVDALTSPPLAYTTVLSTMRTLEEKGYVTHEKFGRAFVYRPLIRRADAANSLLDALLDRFFANSPGVLALTLLEDKRLSKKDLARLMQVIERKGQSK